LAGAIGRATAVPHTLATRSTFLKYVLTRVYDLIEDFFVEVRVNE
jgi:hypothetical protein